MEAYLGNIMLWPMLKVPDGWNTCDGTLLSVTQYQALFSIIGTTYGGDGVKNFALPDLRGRVPIGAGTGQGLTPRALGAKAGNEDVVLTPAQIPPHTHAVQASNATLTLNNNYPPALGVSTNTATQSTPTAFSAIGAAASNYDDGSGPISVYNFGVTEPNVPLANSVNITATGTPATIGVAGGNAHNNIQPTMGINYIICIDGLFPPRPNQ